MRRLDLAGIDCLLPDLPGLNESPQPLDRQTPASWRSAMDSTAARFEATHVLAIRGGALLAPADLPCWRYAPVSGATILRQLVRIRIIAAREAGRDETQQSLIDEALGSGIELAGYHLGAQFIHEFQSLVPGISTRSQDIAQDMLGAGGGLWLRAEAGESREQADALAAIVAIGVKA